MPSPSAQWSPPQPLRPGPVRGTFPRDRLLPHYLGPDFSLLHQLAVKPVTVFSVLASALLPACPVRVLLRAGQVPARRALVPLRASAGRSGLPCPRASAHLPDACPLPASSRLPSGSCPPHPRLCPLAAGLSPAVPGACCSPAGLPAVPGTCVTRRALARRAALLHPPGPCPRRPRLPASRPDRLGRPGTSVVTAVAVTWTIPVIPVTPVAPSRAGGRRDRGEGRIAVRQGGRGGRRARAGGTGGCVGRLSGRGGHGHAPAGHDDGDDDKRYPPEACPASRSGGDPSCPRRTRSIQVT